MKKNFNNKCPACNDMRELGLTFEETHSGEDKLIVEFHLSDKDKEKK